MRRAGAFLVTALALFAFAAPANAAVKDALRAGVGQADITPPKTGYYLGGWTRADRTAQGQSTRLFANTIVLQRGKEKIALVASELFAIPAGLQEDVARKVADLGYTKETILLAASHTHSGPGGFSNNPTFNTAAPSTETITDPISFYKLIQPDPADPQLYTFLVNQIAASIRRADADRGWAKLGWGKSQLRGLTQNRSLFAYLRNYGIDVKPDDATTAMDPTGPYGSIDSNVDVLRVDKLVKKGKKTVSVPIGAYSNFADHGTVVHSETQAYSGDHHAAAWRVFTAKVRRAAKVPSSQNVVMVYPNGAEGDQTAGIQHVGPEAAAWVGTQEANAMFAAWKRAGRSMTRTPALDVRWSRQCFCGRATATGNVDTEGREGLPFVTGSEEGRGPLYDITHVSLEGDTTPFDDPIQGDKIIAPVGSPAPAVPFAVVRIRNSMLASVPGEPTKEVGVGIRSAVLKATAGSGVDNVVIAGLADDYMQYVTTPAEYGAQSYEGASTLYGKNEATFVQERLAELADQLVHGKPASPSYPLDTSYGVHADGPAYGQGADSGQITSQPQAVAQRRHIVSMNWHGGADGEDRPVDKPFVIAERLIGSRWVIEDTDLGLNMLWRSNSNGDYTLEWHPIVPSGTYRLRIAATRYGLTSQQFRIAP
jgi:neutral ceramidase